MDTAAAQRVQLRDLLHADGGGESYAASDAKFINVRRLNNGRVGCSEL